MDSWLIEDDAMVASRLPCGSAAAAIPMAIDGEYKLYYVYKTTKCSFDDSEIKLMPDLKEILKNSLFNQVDDSVSAPISIRLPTILNNELDELSLSLDRSKSSLISEFIKAGVAAANELLKEGSEGQWNENVR